MFIGRGLVVFVGVVGQMCVGFVGGVGMIGRKDVGVWLSASSFPFT